MTTSNGLHVLVAAGGSVHSAEVSDFLLRVLPPNGVRRITILSVINDNPVYPAVGNDGYMYESWALEMTQWEQMMNAARSDAKAAVHIVEQALADRAGMVTSRVETGRPGETIVRAAIDDDADLIVVGSHDHGLLYSAVFGSVSEYVLHHAHRPVLIVPRAVTEPADILASSDQLPSTPKVTQQKEFASSSA